MDRSIGIRAVAAYEAAKGLAVLLVGFGLFGLVHRDVEAAAERLVAHLHLDPASRYPRIFLDVAGRATPAGLRLLAAGALVYAIVRFVEAAGLWRLRPWAEWLGVITGVVYLPFELVACVRRPGPEPFLALLVNLAVVVFLWGALRARRRTEPIWRVDRSMF